MSTNRRFRARNVRFYVLILSVVFMLILSDREQLYLCGQCASRHWRALSAQGWTFWSLGYRALAPQASAASRDDPVQDAA